MAGACRIGWGIVCPRDRGPARIRETTTAGRFERHPDCDDRSHARGATRGAADPATGGRPTAATAAGYQGSAGVPRRKPAAEGQSTEAAGSADQSAAGRGTTAPAWGT